MEARELLKMWGEEVIRKEDEEAAERVAGKASEYGDAKERLLHHFERALRKQQGNSTIQQLVAVEEEEEEEDVSIRVNHVTPFIRFNHLTANQAILDSLREEDTTVHVVDLHIMHGLQWPPFMQALADRPSPPSLRITATGHDLLSLTRTGDRLHCFAVSLGLRFHFQPLLVAPDHFSAVFDSLRPESLPGEALAFNCVLFLHRLLHSDDLITRFLLGVRALRPRVVTLGERDAHLPLFSEAVDHFFAIFNSLEATLPPTSPDRLALEHSWLSPEISASVSGLLRSRRFDWWHSLLRRCGFSEAPLSPFALSQAKLLLRLHYPSDGYRLHCLFDNALLLASHNRPLFSLSSWQCQP